MRVFKVILGLLLLFGMGQEFAHASKQLGAYYSPPILLAALTFVLLSSWLIGSGVSKRKFKFKSFEFVKFFIFCAVLFFFIGFISLATYKTPKEIVEINGIIISYGEFMESNRRIVPEKEERKKYCLCVLEKLANSEEIKKNYTVELETGRITQIIREVKSKDYFTKLKLETCTESIEIVWTDDLASTLKRNFMKELRDTEFEQTNDIQKYCNCIVEEYRKLPFSTINNEVFSDSEAGIFIDKKCTEESTKTK